MRENVCSTGWGVVAVKAEGREDRDESVLVELYGFVILDNSSPFYMGASVGSNNTAELTAIGEALLWVLEEYMRDAGGFAPLDVCIRYDSEYAAKSVLGIYNGQKNRALIDTIRGYHRRLTDALGRRGGKLRYEHVKGHSGDVWNDRADRLATEAARSHTLCRSGRYAQEDGKKKMDEAVVDENDLEYDLPVSSMSRRKRARVG